MSFLKISVAVVSGLVSPESLKGQPLPWMEGCWAFERDGSRHEEIWFPTSINGSLGMARMVRNGKVVSSEFSRIVVGPTAPTTFVALPSGQTETVFTLTTLQGTSAVFENPDHDFPNRVVYSYTAPGQLDARIEGLLNGRKTSVVYPYRRSSCPGSAPTTDG